MDKALLAAYAGTDYRVRLPAGGFASIRIGAALPASLRALSGQDAWAVITAWHPRSRPVPHAVNRIAQRSLLTQLRALPETRLIRAALGVGSEGWREPSLWVVGPCPNMLHPLCVRHDQHAWVMGDAGTAAHLVWTDTGAPT